MYECSVKKSGFMAHACDLSEGDLGAGSLM